MSVGLLFASNVGNAVGQIAMTDEVMAKVEQKFDAAHLSRDPAAVAALSVTRSADFSIGQP